jgi:hypothetical protein
MIDVRRGWGDLPAFGFRNSVSRVAVRSARSPPQLGRRTIRAPAW